LFRLLIADDEKIVLDAMKYIIENNFKNVITLETARSGREAIEKAEMYNPDIILMDIRMPGINGIEAIREIKNRHLKTIFIIVSAYEQFDFAKEAVKLGVTDYILKPIAKKNLISAIESAMDKISGEREIRKKELENIEKYQNIIPLLEYGFIYSMLLGENYSLEISQFKEIFNFNEDGGYIMIVKVEEKDESKYLGDKIEFESGQTYYSVLRDALKCKCQCLVGPVVLNKVVVFVSSPDKEEYSQRLDAYEIASYMNHKLNSFTDKLNFYIGMGSYKKFDNISVSYDEAQRSLFYKNKEIVHIKDILEERSILAEYPKDQENKLLEAIALCEKEKAVEAFDYIYEWIHMNFKDSFEDGKSKLMELMVIVHRTAFDCGFKDKEGKSYLLDLNSNTDYLKLENWCKERIIYILSSLSALEKKKINRIIVMAKDFIYKNYVNDITLEDVSREVCVSPHYFSRLFKEETSENFIEYLTKVRINKAKELMESTDLSIKDICFKIGYTDPNYFSRLFKKIEKVTPSEYMKNLIKY
jgi:two-component system, response regulator YesN